MGYYYHDPSGLGVWWVPDNETPLQAFNDVRATTSGTFSPILIYSVEQNPDARKVGFGNTAPTTTSSPPPPVGYTQQGASLVPVRKTLTPYQSSNTLTPHFKPGVLDTGGPGEVPECPDGYFYDDFLAQCVPISDTPPPVGGGPGTIISGAANPVYVQVNNAVTLSGGVGQAIGDAINTDVQSAIDSTNQAVENTTNTIKAALDDVTSGIGKVVDGIIQNVYKALQWLGNLIINNISTIVGLIRDNIGSLVSTVKDVFTNVIIPLAKQVKDAIDTVNGVIQNTIAPIFNTISQTYNQIQAVVTAIEQDLKHGLTGVLQIPSDVSNAITSIEATIQRTLDQIGGLKRGSATVFTSPTGSDSVWDRLEHIGKGVGILGNVDVQKITFADMVRLSEPDLARAGAATINALVSEVTTLVSGIFSGTTSVADGLKTVVPLGLPLLGAEVGTWIGVWELFRAIEELFEPFYKFAKEDIAAKAGLSKLPTGQVLEAWKRGFINDNDLREDLSVNGWDSGRIQALKDLQKYVVDVETAIDLHYRGVTTDADLAATLKEHGITDTQRAALLEGSIKLFNVNLAATARRWNLIDEQALDAVLRENRYSDTEITAFKATLFQPETIDDTINRERLTILYAGLGYSPEGFADISADALAAASRDGLDSRKALDRWQSSFYVLPLQEWITGYFRNLFTLPQLVAAFDYYRVPSQWRDILVNLRRSIIPWRTIPTMLANGIISEPYAKQQLQAHGFDIVATEALLKYASIATQKKKVAPTGDLHALSVQTVRHYFELGTLTPEQYKQLLLEHGYDEASADLTIQVETQRALALQRKQLQDDIAGEVIAGTITLDQAIAQMDNNKFAPAEKAKVANAIRRANRQSNKVPSEADLHQMVSKGAIAVADYEAALKQDGWSDSWIQSFVKWRFPNAALSTATA